MRRLCVIIIFAALIISFAGCSSGRDAIVAEPADAAAASIANSHQLWGMWQFIADPLSETLDVVQLRTSDMHLNALPFLEPPALVNLSLENLEFNGNIIETDIGLRHPFLGLAQFTGFDVCGIFITNGSVSGFDDAGIVMAGDGETRLLNPDGLTRWWNPAEFPINNGTMFAYNDGLLGVPDSSANYNCTLNGYKYFCDDLAADEPLSGITLESRGLFSAGQKNIRHYTIELGAEGLIFNYAVDADWVFPQGAAPWTAPDDFGPNANRVEAYRIEVSETGNTLYNDGVDKGGGLGLSIDVFDWFNPEMNTVKVESPGNFDIQAASSPTGGGDGFSTYELDITDATPAEGSIDLLISVESEASGYGGLLAGKTISAYFIHTAAVDDEPHSNPTDPVLVDADKGFYHSNFIEDSNGVFHIFASWEDQSDPLYYTWETRWFHSENQGQTWTAEGDIFGSLSGVNQKPPTLGFAAGVDDHGGVYVLMGETKKDPIDPAYTDDILQAKLKYLDTSPGNHDDPSEWSASDWESKIIMDNVYGYRYAGCLYATLEVTPDGRILGTVIDYVWTTQYTACGKYFYFDSWDDIPASGPGLAINSNVEPSFQGLWWYGNGQNCSVYNPETNTFFVSFGGVWNSNQYGIWVLEYDPASNPPWSLSATYVEPTITETTHRLYMDLFSDVTVDTSGNIHWVHQYMKRPTIYNEYNAQFCVMYGKRDITSGTWDLSDNPINGDYILPPEPPDSPTNQPDYERRGINLVSNSDDELICTWRQCTTHPNLLGMTNTGSGWTAMPGNLVLDEADYPIYAFGAQGQALGQNAALTFVSEEDPPVDRRGQLWFFITDGQ